MHLLVKQRIEINTKSSVYILIKKTAIFNQRKINYSCLTERNVIALVIEYPTENKTLILEHSERMFGNKILQRILFANFSTIFLECLCIHLHVYQSQLC